MKRLEMIVERILWESRLMIFLSVISALLAAFVLILMGTYDIILVFKKIFIVIRDSEAYDAFHKESVILIISAIDSYLIATVLLIFGIGLYELFISKIELAESDAKSSKILVVHSLDQLKDKLAKVIVMVLIVTFFKYAVSFKYHEALELLFLSISIFLVATAVYLMGKGHANGDEH